MDLSMIKYLLLGLIVLSVIVIIGTWKLKKIPVLMELNKEKKFKVMIILKDFLQKQIIITVFGIMLFVFVIIYESKADTFLGMMLEIISLVFVACSAIYIMYSYNKFKINFNGTLNEVCK